jgi:branched-chain amino acid transport system substrate-binding protein
MAGTPSGDVLPSSACSPVQAGGREPDVLIASDLPLQGPSGQITRVAADAIRFVLRKHRFRAGPHTVGYQSCDDSTGQSGQSDFLKCASNAKAYAATARVVGVIGPWNSQCAWAQIPIANRAEGPLPMISPSNTYEGLTHRAPGTHPDEPRVYYPTGVRNYFRVTGSGDLDGAAGAVLAKELRLQRVFVLRGTGGIGESTTTPFRRAARRLGITIAGTATWNPEATSYRSLAARVNAARPDAVFIGDALFVNGGEVVKALRARLGAKIVLIAGDAFQPIGELLAAAGRAAIGMYVTTTAVAHEGLGDTGRSFVRDFGRTQPGGVAPSALYVTEAAQAAEALLTAIARSDGTRASVTAELRRLVIDNGILGSFRFDGNGDISPASFTVFRVTGDRNRPPELPEGFGGGVVDRVVRVPPSIARP